MDWWLVAARRSLLATGDSMVAGRLRWWLGVGSRRRVARGRPPLAVPLAQPAAGSRQPAAGSSREPSTHSHHPMATHAPPTPITAPTGTTLTCKGWHQEAAL